MALRKFPTLLVTALAIVATALPGQAADEGYGVATTVAGSISSLTAAVPGGGDASTETDVLTYEAMGQCTYSGSQSANKMFIRYGGGGTAWGPTPALGMEITCEITSDRGDTKSKTFVLPGPVGGSTDDAGPWDVSPITVCVWGMAYFGPTPVVNKPIPKACRRTII